MRPVSSIGRFEVGRTPPAFERDAIHRLQLEPRQQLHVVEDERARRIGVAVDGQPVPRATNGGNDQRARYQWLATLPPIYPEWLGERTFCEAHRLRFPYVAGAMANGIATVELVEEMARAGMLGFFGAAGLSPARVEEAVATLGDRLDRRELSWGSNLIHSPNEPALENAVVRLYLERGVRRVSASAYMDLTPAVVRYALSGLREMPDGTVARRNHLFAKISRPEVARAFMSPAPAEVVETLRSRGELTDQEARLAPRVPVATDVTVEADSGGHTDNRPLGALFPVILELSRKLAARHGYAEPLRIGAAGGLGTPTAVATAFGLGAAYVLTGSVNQACVESGLSKAGKARLAEVGLADVMMAPAADMFEMGVKVQVLRRGSMFGPRASRLYDAYQRHPSLDAMPVDQRERLEREVLGRSCDEVWRDCVDFFSDRAPDELDKAERDPKHRMALVFRWYLGLSSRWAIDGTPERALDYQIWCGPAMGAFNDWVRGSFLEPPENRTVVQVALNLLEGAAVASRAQQLRTFGVPIPDRAFRYTPRRLATQDDR
ncbi:MAG TPA: PfaD family polyunsaturated fatty acid/polyketide biosynthesis protein [Polyangiaceae bacterium]|nr:PfaD family polyunsaturated fatty acid/polyketide biosynthesis protein [Polyangiaceae bacterium]